MRSSEGRGRDGGEDGDTYLICPCYKCTTKQSLGSNIHRELVVYPSVHRYCRFVWFSAVFPCSESPDRRREGNTKRWSWTSWKTTWTWHLLVRTLYLHSHFTIFIVTYTFHLLNGNRDCDLCASVLTVSALRSCFSSRPSHWMGSDTIMSFRELSRRELIIIVCTLWQRVLGFIVPQSLRGCDTKHEMGLVFFFFFLLPHFPLASHSDNNLPLCPWCRQW